MPESVEVPCEKCSSNFLVTQPIADVLNHPNVSMLIWVHTKGDMCPKCRTRHVPFLVDVTDNGFVWKWKAVAGAPRSDEPQILLPPPGALRT